MSTRSTSLLAALAFTLGACHRHDAGSNTAQPVPSAEPVRFHRYRPTEHARLLVIERDLIAQPARYARTDPPARFYPEGLYYEARAQTLWVWSSRHSRQLGLTRSGNGWQPTATRAGPTDTRRCISLRGKPLTLCLGRLEVRGLRAFGSAPFASQLPERSGFVDFAIDEARARIYVIDAYADALWVLDTSGRLVTKTSLVPGAYRIGAAGDEHLFVLASNQPHLSLIPLDRTGLPRAAIAVATVATIRDAAFDASSQLLWTAGYRQARVRRHHGYIENLESFVYGYRLTELKRGRARPHHAIDLSRHALADPVRLLVQAGRVVVATAGSHALASIATPGAPLHVSVRPTGFVPKTVLAFEDLIATAGFLGGRLHLHDRNTLARRQVIALDHAAARRTPYELGEVLFYSKALWADSSRNQFTCNSCHWDGLTDYRMHPGFNETRWEQIRPARGAGMLSPLFTPGQGESITLAVHGFVRILDERFWTAPGSAAWVAPRSIRVGADERRTLSTYDVRLALLTFLARRPVEPGLLRAPGQPFSPPARRGAALFWRDCAGCHRPVARARDQRALTLAEGLRYLRDRPLAFTSTELMQTGVLPYFGPRGNRVSPLTQLSRGGPFFSNGSARSLRDVISRTNVRATPPSNLHAPANATQPSYDAADTQALIDFLLSI